MFKFKNKKQGEKKLLIFSKAALSNTIALCLRSMTLLYKSGG